MFSTRETLVSKIITYVLLFIFLFGPVLNKYGSWADIIFVFSILISLLNFNQIPLNKIYIPFLTLILLFSFLSVRILLYEFLNFSQWLTIALKPFRIIITLFAGYFLAKRIKQQFNERDFVHIIFSVFICISLHAIIMISQFLNIEFKDFIYSYTTNGEFRSSFEYDFRMGGLSGSSGGSVLSVIQSIGIIILPFLFKLTKKYLFNILLLILALLILFSIIVCGRSGILCIILFLPISIYFVVGGAKTLRYLLVTSFVFFFIFIILENYVLDSDDKEFFYAFNRTFETFINFKETGQLEDNTTNVLIGHILFPDFSTLLFGDNDALVNTQFERKLDSDIGYIRNIFSFGIIGYILYYFPLLNLLFLSFKNRFKSISFNILLILILIMLFFEAKEMFSYVRMFWSIIALLLGYISLSYNSKRS